MTEPLLARLHARGEQISVAALPWVAPVYRALSFPVDVIELPFRHGALQWAERRVLAKTWRERFDRAYVCPNSLKSALLPWMAGIPVRVGYRGEFRLGLLTHRAPNPPRDHRPPMVDFYAALGNLASPAGDSTGGCDRASIGNLHQTERPHLQMPLAEQQAALQAHGLSFQGHMVMAPGAEYGSAKRWPEAHFAELAARLEQDVVLLGSAKDRAVCDDIVARAQASKRRGRLLNLAGQTSLAQAFALIASAHRVVSNDSGLMHVAAALDVPQVAVFGSSSPEHTPPLSPKAQVIWLKWDARYQPALDCAPCFERECPLGHRRCLQDIHPEQVLQALAV
jgi:heptosyltransferase-2